MIAYIYRPKRQRNGKLASNRIWRARLKLNGDVKPRDISLGVSDKQVAEQKLREITRDHGRAMSAPEACETTCNIRAKTRNSDRFRLRYGAAFCLIVEQARFISQF